MNKHVLLGIMACSSIAISCFISWITCDWKWFSRSGSLIVIAALITEYWKVITTPLADNMPFWTTPEGHSAMRAAILFICIGTLIWGFGDLVGQLQDSCMKNDCFTNE